MEQKQLENNIKNLVQLKQKVETSEQSFFSADVEPKENEFHDGKHRIWCLLLYPDNEYHRYVYENIFYKFVGLGALHDSDVDAITGKPIKNHWHVVLYLPNHVHRSYILEQFPQLEPRFVQYRKEIKRQIRYLLHLDSPSKFQYPDSYLEGHLEKFYKYIDADTLESAQAMSVISLLKEKEMFIQTDGYRLINFIEDICNSGLYSVYRRNAYTFNLIFSEMKQKFIEEKQKNRK